MSGYEKSQNADLSDYNVGRSSQTYASLANYNASCSSQEPMYLAYAMPGQAEAQAQSSSEAYDPHADQMVYGTSSLYEPRATYEATQSNFNDFSLRKAPEVSSYNPQRGSGGSQVCVYFDSSSDLLAPSPLIASLMFATRRIPAALNRLETRERDVCYKYVVTADAPSFSTTGSTNARVPLRVQFQEQSGQDAGLVDVGPFLYTDDQQAEPRYSSHEASRKRKQPVESSVSSRLAEPAQIQQQMNVNSQDYSSYSYTTGGNLAYPQSLHSIDLTSMQRRLTPYGRSQSQSSYHNASSTTGGQDFPGVAAVSQSFMRPPMPQTSAWSPSYTGSYQPSTPQSFPLVSSPSPDLANPQLVRTTKLQQSQSPGSTTAGSSSGEPYNPWAIYPNKADLKIQGSLNSMQEKWTPEEIAAKRRLIRFRREQSGTIINAYFRPCKADERLSPHETGEPRISCIYWEERQEYFVTSVDTISLLEYLVRTRFGVEEKNRIRRNLEGFHPLTVSKAKQDSEEFFKVVMGFPNPKPRNIEKDVKVFLWKDLNMALKKIISKYSASHSSTTGPLRTPRSSVYSGGLSDLGTDPHANFSSRSASNSTSSSAYAQTLKSSTMSPPSVSHVPSGHYSEHSPSQVSVPSLAPSYAVPTLGSQYIPQDTSRSRTGSTSTSYAEQVCAPRISHAYTAATTGKHRQSNDAVDTVDAAYYAKRPRNLSTSSYYTPRRSTDASLGQSLTDQAGRASWDFSAYLQSNPTSADPDSAQATQYRRESVAKQGNPQTYQYKQESTDLSKMQTQTSIKSEKR